VVGVIDLERRLGPWSLRVWGLIANLLANATALYGAAGMLRDGSGTAIFITGLTATVVCLLVLATPAPDVDARDRE
jgi:hypothetical protein